MPIVYHEDRHRYRRPHRGTLAMPINQLADDAARSRWPSF
jgi:hypothetical protein